MLLMTQQETMGPHSELVMGYIFVGFFQGSDFFWL